MTPLTPQQRSEIFHDNTKRADCTVIALQSITGMSYQTAEKEALAHGYGGGDEGGKGMKRGNLEDVLRSLGYKTERILEQGDTPATFAMDHPHGKYLLYTWGHVGALVDGDLLNFHNAWNGRLEMATKVTAP